jgi:tetratricopeptide (TPR) repeat protein
MKKKKNLNLRSRRNTMPIRSYRSGLLAFLAIFLVSSAFGAGPDLQSAQAWFEKGMLYTEAGNAQADDAFGRAIKDLDSYIGKETDRSLLSRAYILRAKCRMFRRGSKSALPDLDKAVELAPDDGDTYYLRSFAHYLAKDQVQYLDDLKTAAQKGNEKAQGELKAKGLSW